MLPRKIISAAHFCCQKSNFAAQKNKNVAAQKNNFAAHFTNSLKKFTKKKLIFCYRAKKEAYIQNIYHSVGIEGNTMTLTETRTILETRMAVGGKSIDEHNEILGLDAAMKFINASLVNKYVSLISTFVSSFLRNFQL